jgi:hypothetical protein
MLHAHPIIAAACYVVLSVSLLVSPRFTFYSHHVIQRCPKSAVIPATFHFRSPEKLLNGIVTFVGVCAGHTRDYLLVCIAGGGTW